MAVDGRMMGVNMVGETVEVGGKVIEIAEVEEEVPLEDAGATGVLGATGFEAGRVNASEGGNLVRAMVDPRLRTEEEVATMSLHICLIGIGVLHVLKLRVRI